MTKRIWTGVFTTVVGFATVAITAQTTPSPQTNSSSNDRRITITGCLKEAPVSPAGSTAPAAAGTVGTAGTTATAGTAGTAGTTGTTAAAATAGTTGDAAASTPKFLLTNAAPSVPDAASATSTTAAPTPPAASAPAAQTYRLIANPAALSPHIGKKLELTGTLEEAGAATATTESSAGSESNAASLRVESGKVVAASCSQQ